QKNEVNLLIWVIGDIHGLTAPLTRILAAIKERHENVEPVKKIIFIGDYIDHGLDSKGVLDILLDLEYPAVFLLGNHEDLALRYLDYHSMMDGYFWNNWKNNGGRSTYASLFTQDFFQRNEALGRHGSGKFKDKRDPMEPKYMAFFRNLVPSWQETITYGSQRTTFYFFHALPRYDHSLADQLLDSRPKLLRYHKNKRYHFYLNERRIEEQFVKGEDNQSSRLSRLKVDGSFLWNRCYSLRYPYWGGVIIHGHTPTINYDSLYCRSLSSTKLPKAAISVIKQFHDYREASRLPFFFSRGKRAGFVWPKLQSQALKLIKKYGVNPKELKEEKFKEETLEWAELLAPDLFALSTDQNIVYNPGLKGAVEAINVDTGSVYDDGALTALGFSSRTLSQGEFEVLTSLTVKEDDPQRSSGFFSSNILSGTTPKEPSVLFRIIKTERLGADMSAPGNKLFDYERIKRPPDEPFKTAKTKATSSKARSSKARSTKASSTKEGS
ncbi:MAG: metallophosphoesterase, partial [Deltaproteobacteria bacterium]|nr:metallophosphoesterase [Deltaproteobacteria bacterium]